MKHLNELEQHGKEKLVELQHFNTQQSDEKPDVHVNIRCLQIGKKRRRNINLAARVAKYEYNKEYALK